MCLPIVKQHVFYENHFQVIKNFNRIGFGNWMCRKIRTRQKDGRTLQKRWGAKIYETVKLSPEFFEANGLIKNKEYSREGNKIYLKIATDFILINEIIYIKEGDPLKGQGMLLRSKSELRRISDNSLLAEEVKYGRSGGDIWFFNLPTQASCPSKPIDIVNEVFKK
ncbi:hypothetical protein MTYM_01007 [Methylococcales bacterium]|nr:hypothetical protein MTYM_01007 [Methylococcales bacterium]